MKNFPLFLTLTAFSLLLLSCAEESKVDLKQLQMVDELHDTTGTIDTRGYWENGAMVTEFDCPDSRFFPPIDIKNWDKIPVVNGRLPSYKETLNGTSIHTYNGNKNPAVKAYPITLPKLAYYINAPASLRMDSTRGNVISKPLLVVVIQMVQTRTDTLVGYRYLTGGVGGSYYRNFHFLIDEEIQKEVQSYH